MDVDCVSVSLLESLSSEDESVLLDWSLSIDWSSSNNNKYNKYILFQ